MKTIKGPAIFLAQFVDNKPPYDSLENLCAWAKMLGYKGIQIPSWDKRCIDLQKAAESKTYADEILATVSRYNLQISELSTHLQGQLIAVHPAYDTLFDGFAPKEVHGNSKERTKWATHQLNYAAKASENLKLKTHASFSGSLLWPFVYPWPQRPQGLVEQAFSELAKRWLPILNKFDECGVDICYELHAGEDLHDGISYERFLEAVHQHKRACLLYDPSHYIIQCLDYLEFIDFYHERIKAFHVKDAEFRPSGKQGVYGGFASWQERSGRFRSLGDGMVDFKQIFSKLTQYDYDGWAVLEWECPLKDSEQGATEGALFIKQHIIQTAQKTFDDFAGSGVKEEELKKILGMR